LKQIGLALALAVLGLAMPAGEVSGQASFDTAKIPQPHLAAAIAIAAGANSWRHPGLSTCYPDDADAVLNSSEIAPPATRIFDNLYYVGNNNLSVFALDTSAGIILFDSMENRKEVDQFVIPGLRKVGLDPARLKVLIISHGHDDHIGGGRYLQEKYGMQVYMSGADWDLIERPAPNQAQISKKPLNEQRRPPKRDRVVKDGDTIALGDESIKVFISPGHTPGSLSMLVPVKDHGRPRLLAYFGGAGNLFITLDLHAAFDRSVARLIKIVTDAKVDGYISGHVVYSDAIFKLEVLRSRPQNPNPFLIGTAETVRFLKEIKECNLNNFAIQRQLPTWRVLRGHVPVPK
jgi:metallo-beta-lactamase class B